MELGPSISDDEDFDGSGYGSDDEYYSTKIQPIQVQCQVDPPPEQETKATTNRKVRLLVCVLCFFFSLR